MAAPTSTTRGWSEDFLLAPNHMKEYLQTSSGMQRTFTVTYVTKQVLYFREMTKPVVNWREHPGVRRGSAAE